MTPAQRELAKLGRYMMDAAIQERDDAFSNIIATTGYDLTTVGAPQCNPKFTEEQQKIIQKFAKKMYETS